MNRLKDNQFTMIPCVPRPRGDEPIAQRAGTPKLIALACSDPPKGRVRWTLKLLESAVVELDIVDRASDNTIGRTLKKTFSSLTFRSNGSFPPTPTPRS